MPAKKTTAKKTAAKPLELPTDEEQDAAVDEQALGLAELFSAPRRIETWIRPANPNDADEVNKLRAVARAAQLSIQNGTGDEDTLARMTSAANMADKMVANMACFVFEFGSIGMGAVTALLKAHQTDEKTKNGAAQLFDPVRYPLALMAATLIKVTTPDGNEVTSMTPAQFAGMFDTKGWTDSDFNEMFTVANNCETQTNRVSFDAVKKG